MGDNERKRDTIGEVSRDQDFRASLVRAGGQSGLVRLCSSGAILTSASQNEEMTRGRRVA